MCGGEGVEDGAINLDVHTGQISECVGGEIAECVGVEIAECDGVDLHGPPPEGILLVTELPDRTGTAHTAYHYHY
jgi:hypothetical protein